MLDQDDPASSSEEEEEGGVEMVTLDNVAKMLGLGAMGQSRRDRLARRAGADGGGDGQPADAGTCNCWRWPA